MSAPLLLVVAAGLINEQGQILLAQRPQDKSYAGYWEFPGGKVDVGERPEAALARELHEELGITVSVDALTPFTFASHPYPEFHLLMPFYLCRAWQGTPCSREGQALAWVALDALHTFQILPADGGIIRHLLAKNDLKIF